jgi:hypothetical protein
MKSLLLVGQRPSLGGITGEIVCGSPEHFIELKKGGACATWLERMGDLPKGVMLALAALSILQRVAVR